MTATISFSLIIQLNGGLENAILRNSELLSAVNDAFCKTHPLLAPKVVTRSAHAAVRLVQMHYSLKHY